MKLAIALLIGSLLTVFPSPGAEDLTVAAETLGTANTRVISGETLTIRCSSHSDLLTALMIGVALTADDGSNTFAILTERWRPSFESSVNVVGAHVVVFPSTTAGDTGEVQYSFTWARTGEVDAAWAVWGSGTCHLDREGHPLMSHDRGILGQFYSGHSLNAAVSLRLGYGDIVAGSHLYRRLSGLVFALAVTDAGIIAVTAANETTETRAGIRPFVARAQRATGWWAFEFPLTAAMAGSQLWILATPV